MTRWPRMSCYAKSPMRAAYALPACSSLVPVTEFSLSAAAVVLITVSGQRIVLTGLGHAAYAILSQTAAAIGLLAAGAGRIVRTGQWRTNTGSCAEDDTSLARVAARRILVAVRGP